MKMMTTKSSTSMKSPGPANLGTSFSTRSCRTCLWNPSGRLTAHCEFQCEGWQQIASALQEHGQGLSLPPGAKSPEEVVPADLRHKLWLQFCFNNLMGWV